MDNPELRRLLAATRMFDMLRAAEQRRRVDEARRNAGSAYAEDPADAAVTIRYAFPDDAGALARLASLDSSPVPPQPLLVAEVGDRLRAGLSLADGTSIADPFHHTAGVLELLRLRAAQLCPPAGRGRRRGRRGERARGAAGSADLAL